MSSYALRRAGSRDARQIRSLIRRSRINPTGLNWRRFWVAVDREDRVIGCGQIKPHGGGVEELASIAVEKEWQGRGIARAVIEHLLEASDRPLYLTCRSSLEPFYTRFGFHPVAPEDMPPYFRRIWGLFGVLRRMLRGEGLSVMVIE